MKTISLNIEKKVISLGFDEHFSNLVKINEALNFSAWDNYQKMGLVYTDVPEVVGITGACENVDTLFKVYNRHDLPLFFTQTGQLSLEQALQSFHGVFTVIHSGRDEEIEDERHLRQFRLTEEEFDCTMVDMTRGKYDEDIMFESLLNHIQLTIQAMIKGILKDNGETLKKTYKRDIKKLERASKTAFLRIDYEKAIKLLNKNGYQNIKFGDDLKADHEAKIVKLLNKKDEEIPVFITRYPKEIKFFNMKVSSKDPKVVLSADLIFPHAGEGTGSAVREHDFEKLNERLLTSTMYRLHLERGGKYEDFKWYLDIMKSKKTSPHAGYGIGNERVLQYIFGEKDIRNISLFSLLSRQTGDWDIKKYGQASIFTSPKKNILLSIGKKGNKKFLLPHLKKLSKSENVIFYATENTYKILKENNVLASQVYKISEIGKTPNISDLLAKRVFDLIINIPTRDKVKEKKEFTDGKLIRKTAVEMGISLITDPEVAAFVFDNLSNEKKN